MFTIIGGDGKEYGPASTEQIRAWLAGGRANLETRARRSGDDTWRPLGNFPEFGGSAPGAEPPLVVAEAELGSRWVRLGASIMDQVILVVCLIPSIPIFGVDFVLDILNNPEGPIDPIEPARVFLGLATILALGGAYLIVQIWWLTTRGQTIAKRMLGLRIVRVADGGNPGFVSAFLLRRLVPSMIGGIPVVGIIFTLTDILFIFRADRRCVHDLMAGTRVVRV